MTGRLCKAAFVFGLLAPAAAQAPAATDPAAIARADQLLAAHAELSRGVKVLVASYVQRRTTKLSQEPLLSRGEFLFVREPACVVFRATTPRVSIVRLRARTYEVYRPAKRQLERFSLDGPELAEGLFAAVGGDVERLRRDFDVRACADDPSDAMRTRIQLVPKTATVRERLQELILTVGSKDAVLHAVAYRDAAGDLIEIELLAPRKNPTDAPPADFEVAPDAVIVEHAPPPKKKV